MGEKEDLLFVNRVNKGFELPEGYKWNATLTEGKKEEEVIVKDKENCYSHVLYFEHDKLNGICAFYDKGTIVERRTFVDDVEEGWACELERKTEVRWYWYVNGVKKAELKMHDDLKDYWKAVDIASDQVISVCKYNENHKPTGKGYLFENGHIVRIVLFDNGKEKVVLKSFNENEMIEYDDSGMVVYKGGYVNDLSKDYGREGQGKEYAGYDLVYRGDWKNGKRDGEGKSLKGGLEEYDGGWKDGLPNGKGLFEEDGVVYDSEWVMGKMTVNEEVWFEYVNGQFERADVKRSVKQNHERKLVQTTKMMIKNENQLRELVKNDDKKRKVKELVIEEGCGNEMDDDLIISGFENLESLIVKKNSLQNLYSLEISKNPVLRRIEIEDGSFEEGAFECVERLIMESGIIAD